MCVCVVFCNRDSNFFVPTCSGKKKFQEFQEEVPLHHIIKTGKCIVCVPKEFDLKYFKISGIFVVTPTSEQKVLQQYTHCVGFDKASSEFRITHLNMK